ncbi:MAG TPA: VOC family protein [Pararobbsia sp.]|jgi:predicted enzyme related to lactoylglutathione lyase|nr:VOC family protein [Pararobbsia sp.]
MAVTGIGGMFFRARDPGALLEWYRVHLGIGIDGPMEWRQEGGLTVFLPFAGNTDYWPASRQWMINFRVSDLDALLCALKQAGIGVETDPTWNSPDIGRFARIHDPEGNPIELWEPPAA